MTTVVNGNCACDTFKLTNNRFDSIICEFPVKISTYPLITNTRNGKSIRLKLVIKSNTIYAS